MLLREALNSVPAQETATQEVIVCDDGSTEEMSAAREYSSKLDFPVTWSRTEARLGAQVARNRGMALAQGDVVLFMDSDDALAEGGILPLLQTLNENPNLDYAFGKVIRTDAQLQPLPGSAPVGKPFPDTLVEVAGYHWHTMGAVYRKAFLKKVGPWNEALTGSQDWEYQARVKLAGGRGQFVDSVVGYWRQHGGSRVGAQAFRPDYVRSVMLACDAVWKTAQRSGQDDPALARRLAKKLILHALEWGAHGYTVERQQCLRQAAQTLLNDRSYWLLAHGLKFSPAWLDCRLWKALARH